MSVAFKRLLYITNVLAKRRQRRPATEAPISVAVRNIASLIPRGRMLSVHPSDPKRFDRLSTEIRSGFKNEQNKLATQNITLLDSNGRPLVTVQDLDAYLNPVTNPVPVIAYAIDASGPPMPIAALAPYTPPKIAEPIRPKAQLTDEQLLEAVREEVSGTARLNLADDPVTMQRKLTPLLSASQHPLVKGNASRIAHDLAHAVVTQSRQAAIQRKTETQAIASFLRAAPVWKTLADNKPIAHIFQPPQVSYNKYSTVQTASIKTPILDAKAMSSLLRTDPIKNADKNYVHIGAQAYSSDTEGYAPFETQDIACHRTGWCPTHGRFHGEHRGILSGAAHTTGDVVEGTGHFAGETVYGAAHATGDVAGAALAVPGQVLHSLSRIACPLCLPNDPCVLHGKKPIQSQLQDLDAFMDDSDGGATQSNVGCLYCTPQSACDEHQGRVIGCSLCKLLGVCHKHKKEAKHMHSLINNIGDGLHLGHHHQSNESLLIVYNWMMGEPVTLYVDGSPMGSASFLHSIKVAVPSGVHTVAIQRGAEYIMRPKQQSFTGGHSYVSAATEFSRLHPHKHFVPIAIHSSLPQAQPSTAFVRATIHNPELRVSFLDAEKRMTPLSETYTPVPAGTSAFYIQTSPSATPAPVALNEPLSENGLYDYHLARNPESSGVLSIETKTHTLPESSSFSFGRI